MQLVASPMLSKEDIAEIESGYAARDAIEHRALERVFDEVFSSVVQQRVGILAWLIQYDRLDIKIAIVNRSKNYAIYHEKIGIFSDGKDFIAFTGSPNESESGLVSNFECIDVFCSWKPEDAARVQEKQANFERLWRNRTNLLKVYDFPQAAREKLIQLRPANPFESDPEVVFERLMVTPAGCPKVPDTLKLRPYQEQAISNWLRNNGRGTFKMATGSGKTITALSTAAKLYELIQLQALIVICPYRHLVTQWSRECAHFGLSPVRCYESRSEWSDLLRGQLYNLAAGTIPFVTVVTTNSTFGSASFQSVLGFFPKKTLLVGDEVHNLGAPHRVSSLPDSIGLRLALSATPERWFDEDGTAGIYRYFGPVLEPEFTLRDALACGALVPYRYQPVFVSLTDEEKDQYIQLSRKIGRLLGKGNSSDLEQEQQLTSLLNRRSRLVGSAKNKLSELRRIMENRLDTTHTLFYCGDGTVEEPASKEMVRHLDAVCKLLGHDLNYRVDTYTAETTLDEREDLRDRFVRGDIQGLVAIRCLDEGVDIPLIQTAFILASSTNPRQFVQRRGRVLRPHSSKKEAEIFDFIVLPPTDASVNPAIERNLLRRELCRYVEFADLAINSGEVRGMLVELQRRYGLMSM